MPSKTQSIVLGGLAIGVANVMLGLIPIAGGCLVCLAYIGAGLLATWHYTTVNELTITGGQGAGVGALAGIVAVVIGTIISLILSKLGITPDTMEAMRKGFEQSGMDPSQQEQLIELFSSPLAYAGLIFLGIIIGSLLGAAGGAIGASMFKKGGEMPLDTEDLT